MENTETKRPRKKILPAVMGTILLIGAVIGIIKYTYALHHEVTDDAQIEGDVYPVLARVSGYVNKISFEENQIVSKGDTLIQLDDRDLKIKVQQSEAALENAKAGVDVARANISTAQSNLQVARSGVEAAKVKVWKATQDFNRYQNLLKDKAITEQQFETAKAEKDNADAQLRVAEGQETSASVVIASAEKQVAVSQSVVSQKQAELDYAKLQISYSTIIAPANGYASRKNVMPGQLVNVGSPLFAVVSDSDIYVVANFKETQLDKMKKDETVEIKVDAYPDTTYEGKIYMFSPVTGAKFSLLPPDNATGNFVKVVQRVPVKIVLDGGKELRSKLRPGMSVKVAVRLD